MTLRQWIATIIVIWIAFALRVYQLNGQSLWLDELISINSIFLAKFDPAVDSIAKKRGLLFVLNQDSGVLAWADPKLDITTEVITAVNEP